MVNNIEVARLLIDNKLKISCAESCTGGLLSSTLTDVSGSSAYLQGAVVAYANEVKQGVLGVAEVTLDKYGAVSSQTAREMAEGALRIFGTDIGVSTTGIAGPRGATETKPVGLVFIAVASKSGTIVKECHFTGNRANIKDQSVQTALDMLYDYLISR